MLRKVDAASPLGRILIFFYWKEATKIRIGGERPLTGGALGLWNVSNVGVGESNVRNAKFPSLCNLTMTTILDF